MSKIVNLALVQMDSTENVDKNLNSIKNIVNIASKKADLIIFPEHCDGIGLVDDVFAHSIPGKISSFFSSLANDNNVFIHCGSIAELGPKGKPYNTSVLFAPDGTILDKYSKLHLFDVDLPDGTGCRESSTATAGNKIVVADTKIGKIGMSICYDLRFAELYRAMALMGAELLVVSANFTAPTGKYHWLPLIKARAIENGCFVAGVNQCGTKPQFEAYGHTVLVDPWGKIVGELGDTPDVLYAQIDLDLVEETRTKIPSLKNRRTDIY